MYRANNHEHILQAEYAPFDSNESPQCYSYEGKGEEDG